VPDTFQDGAEVVLRGQLQSDGFHVVNNGVMAKCPSKYDEQKLTAAGVKR
jgi:cytochrome c-type biogenesis protein CcmE